jgi:hypothetical protein
MSLLCVIFQGGKLSRPCIAYDNDAHIYFPLVGQIKIFNLFTIWGKEE